MRVGVKRSRVESSANRPISARGSSSHPNLQRELLVCWNETRRASIDSHRHEPAVINMFLFTHLPRARPYVCRQCILNRRAIPTAKRSYAKWAGKHPTAEAEWEEQSMRIQTGGQPSMLRVLEERGYVKDIAGCVLTIVQCTEEI